MFENFYEGNLKKKRIDLFDFNNSVNGRIDGHLSKYTRAKNCYNFDYTDGALKCGIGVKPLEILLGENHYVPKTPENLIPKKLYYYKRYDDETDSRDDRIIVLFSGGDIYEWKIYSGTGEMTKINGLSFTSAPFGVNYRLNSEDVILFSADGKLYVYNGKTVTCCDAPTITSMCIHNERLYATAGNSETELWFSKTFDPTNWNLNLDEGGFIDFRGKAGGLLKVVSIDGYLYAFANYGVYRITAYNDQLEMTAEALYLNSGRIIKNSVTECGRYVIYLAEDGFYRFDGSSSYRILSELDKYLKGANNEDVSAIYHNGKFYASVRLKTDKLYKAVVCYDVASKEFYLAKGLNVYDLEKIDGDGFSFLAVLSEGYNELGTLSFDGALFGNPLSKIWKSNPSDYGVYGEKTLSYVSLYTRSDVIIEFESERGKKSVDFNGSLFRQKKPVGLKGVTFTVTVKSKSKNAEVSKVLLELQYL